MADDARPVEPHPLQVVAEIDAEDPDATLCAVCGMSCWRCPGHPKGERDRLTVLLALAKPFMDWLMRRATRWRRR